MHSVAVRGFSPGPVNLVTVAPVQVDTLRDRIMSQRVVSLYRKYLGHDPCVNGRSYLMKFKSAREAWDKCEDPDWMFHVVWWLTFDRDYEKIYRGVRDYEKIYRGVRDTALRRNISKLEKCRRMRELIPDIMKLARLNKRYVY